MKDCFDSIDWAILLEKINPLADPYLRLLIKKWISAPRVGGPPEQPGRGIPQGGVVSPALCNLVLSEFDLEMHRLGIPEVRYADDCLLFAPSEKKARRVLLAAADILHGLKLEPNIEKTEIVTFTGGFRFLGTLFVRSIVLPCIKIKTASGQTRYVSGYDSGAKRKRGQQRVQVRRERGHIAVEGPLKERDLQRLVAKAIVDETEGKTTALGRALLRAWRKELAKSAPAPEAPVDRRATVALLL